MEHSEEFLNLVNDARTRVKEISPQETWERLQAKDQVYLVDCREDNEWKISRAKNAMHIGKGVIERDIEKKIPNKKAEIILYCGGGYRSLLAADALQKMGHQNIYSMEGGFRKWQELGLPVESQLESQ